MRLVLVSENPHKARELAAALPGWQVEPWTGPPLPPERVATFRENARGKAAFGREHAPPGAWVAGEDSGLEVTGLGGRPGIFSARYAGEHSSDDANTAKLLEELDGLEPWSREARYVCALVALSPDGDELAVEGTLEGAIAEERRGSAGFGYDPVFVPEGETRTVAELGDEWKAAWSHRARAARALAAALGERTPTV